MDLDSNRYKYKVGQTVRYNSDVLRRIGSGASFKIVRLMPPEGDSPQYRIKSMSEAYERVANEYEIQQDF